MNDDNKAELYKKLLEQEISNHTIFVSVLLGIVILVIGSTWWWNKYGALKEIEAEVEKRFQKEKKKISKRSNKKIKQKIKREVLKYKNQILYIEADVARSLAISARNDEFYSHSIYWFSKYVENNLKLDLLPNVRTGVEWIIGDLDLLKDQDDGDLLKFIHSCDEVVEIIEQLPDVLEKEKKKILKACVGRFIEDEDDDEDDENEDDNDDGAENDNRNQKEK